VMNMGSVKIRGLLRTANGGKPVANSWNAGSFNRNPSPQCGLSTHFFMHSSGKADFRPDYHAFTNACRTVPRILASVNFS
jgi:hypothetical protein